MTTEFPAIYCVGCGRRLLVGEAHQCIECVVELAEELRKRNWEQFLTDDIATSHWEQLSEAFAK